MWLRFKAVEIHPCIFYFSGGGGGSGLLREEQWGGSVKVIDYCLIHPMDCFTDKSSNWSAVHIVIWYPNLFIFATILFTESLCPYVSTNLLELSTRAI